MSAAIYEHREAEMSFVSTEAPTASQQRTALVVAAVSVVVFALIAPFAKVSLHASDAFLPIYQSALIVFDLITCVLLLGQFRMLRNKALLLLASGYGFSAWMAAAHALSFPGLFAPEGVIGGGGQTTAWIYFFWHGGFALFILAYAICDRPTVSRFHGPLPVGVRFSLALGLAAAGAFVVLATRFHEFLPVIMSGNQDASGKLVVACMTWIVGIAALAVLWRRPSHTVLDLWLMVVLCVWIADTALAAVLNHGRYDVGWYAGRIYGLLANGFVLAILLLESGSMYARLATSNELLAEALSEMRRLNTDLEAFAGSLAHDLQQPLVTISGFARVMESRGLSEQDHAHIQRILNAAQGAKDMIRALLEFARLGESELKVAPVDLNRVVAQARLAVTPTESLRDIQWMVGALPTVDGDAQLLLLAFTNLLSNAVKYTRSREHAVIRIDAHASSPGTYAIRVHDNGVGFEETQAARLFAPFERLHHQSQFEGTGIGLANVKRIVQRHCGSVSASGQLGQGAVFEVVLYARWNGEAAARHAGTAAVSHS
jgi:signal transduction histidine kinase